MLNNLKYVAQLYEAKAIRAFAEKNTQEAIRLANLSLDCDPRSVNMLYNLGGYYLTLQQVDKARDAWKKALAIEPGNATVKEWLNRISGPPMPTK
jgi:tetratricopeptide (TPR) repeat protein